MRGHNQPDLGVASSAVLLAWVYALVLATPATAGQGVVYAFTNFVGQPGVSGQADGIGRAARFYCPRSVALAGDGTLYVADSFNETIRKVTPSGVVTTLAGTPGQVGSADGTGGDAMFAEPLGLVLNSAGNLIVADSGNSTIRLVTTNGVVTTLAGAPGQNGSADGVGAAARFNFPAGLAVDTADNVYIADFLNHTIRKMTPDGMVTTVAGLAGNDGHTDGAGSAARFQRPTGVALDKAGNLYIADYGNMIIRKMTPIGAVTTFAGTYGNFGSADGPPGVGKFTGPYDLTVDTPGNLYVVDQLAKQIRKVTPDGVVTTLAGMKTNGSADGVGSGAGFALPGGLALDPLGYLYVADNNNHRITRGLPIPAFTSSSISTGIVTWTLDGLLGGATVVTEASTNLQDWFSVQTNVAGPFPAQVPVLQALPPSARNQFLRAIEQIPAGKTKATELNM